MQGRETGERLIRLPEVKHLTGYGRASIYRLQKSGLFPHSVSLGGGHAIAWKLSAVMNWIASREAK